jgi:hypothetical protein
MLVITFFSILALLELMGTQLTHRKAMSAKICSRGTLIWIPLSHLLTLVGAQLGRSWGGRAAGRIFTS